MRSLAVPFRLLFLVLFIGIYLLHMAVLRTLIRRPWARVRWSNRILSRYSVLGLKILKLKVNVIGAEQLSTIRGGLLVGNHLSYMDVLVISSVRPTCFVTSTEIRDAPGLGLICKMAGCLFVERRNKQNIMNEISELREGLQVGLSVVIFPEATSTNGEQIKRFRRPLFVSAIDSGAPVVPFCLNYRRVGGAPIDHKNRDKIMWYDDMTFVPHLSALAASGGVDLDIHFLPPIYPSLKTDPTALAEQAQSAVESVFLPIINPETTHKESQLQRPL